MPSSLKISHREPVIQTTYRVLYGDTDAGGVVYNANYLRFFEFGRSEFMRTHVCSYRMIEEMGFVLPVVESYLRYKSPARYDDELLITTSMRRLSDYSWRFHHHILATATHRLLVKGFTVHAAINKEGKLARLPGHVIDLLENASTPLDP